MTKDTSVHLPSKLAGFGKVDYEKWYKVEAENVPSSLCIPQAPTSMKMIMFSESVTLCNTMEKIVCNFETDPTFL
jgi:hypothetical protein